MSSVVAIGDSEITLKCVRDTFQLRYSWYTMTCSELFSPEMDWNIRTEKQGSVYFN